MVRRSGEGLVEWRLVANFSHSRFSRKDAENAKGGKAVPFFADFALA